MAKPKQTTVQVGINENRFLTEFKGFFASSYSFLGELMQNARRAGATKVEFSIEDGLKLVVRDDGSGIKDFQALITLSRSDWTQEVMHAEMPFGMGAFSIIFAGQTVAFRSAGKLLVVTPEDIQPQFELQVIEDPAPIFTGTQIEISGISEAFINGISFQLRERARGFPIDVLLDGEVLPRPHATSVLPGTETEIGFVSLAGIHVPGPVETERNFSLYLQGLPISTSGLNRSANVIHLDAKRFSARMPDRDVLRDEREQLARIRGYIRSAVRGHFRKLSMTMDPADFAETHWADCLLWDLQDILVTNMFVPYSAMYSICQVSRELGASYEISTRKGVVSREQIIAGEILIWRDANVGLPESTHMPAIHRAMQASGILSVKVPEGHWLEKLSPACVEIRVAGVNASGVHRKVEADFNVDAVLADTVEVTFSAADYPEFSFRYVEDTSWIVVPSDLESDDIDFCGEYEPMTCYFTPKATGTPELVFDDFLDANDRFSSDAHSQAIAKWSSVIHALNGSSLATSLQQHVIGPADFTASEVHLGQMALVRTVQVWSEALGSFRAPSLAVIELEDPDFWAAFLAALPQASGIDAQALKDAFFKVAKPGEMLGAEEI